MAQGRLGSLPPDVVSSIVQQTPTANARLAQTAHGVRTLLNGMWNEPPVHFYANLDTHTWLTEAQRRDSVLHELEGQANRWRLEEIDVAGIKLDDADAQAAHPPMLAPVRGAVRLAAVLRASGANLRALDLSHTRIYDWREIEQALPFCQALERVTLSGSIFRTTNNPFLGLAQCASLRELVIEFSDLRTRCAQLAPVLTLCRRLESLSLASNNLGMYDVTLVPPAPVVHYVVAGLWQHPALARLDLRNCNLNERALRMMLNFLPFMPALAHLDLSDNAIGGRKIPVLAAILQGCAALRHLHLRDNILSPQDLADLAAAQAFRGLESLSLQRCDLDLMVPGGGRAFVQELAHCQQLAHLDLSENNLGNSFVRGLAALLGQLPSLEHLDLRDTQITDAGMRALALNVELSGLTQLNVSDCHCSAAAAQELREKWRGKHGHLHGLVM